MPNTKIILSICAIILVIGIFLLPKAVVDNDASSNAETAGPGSVEANTSTESQGIDAMHNVEIPPEDQNLLTNLREKYKSNEDPEKKIIFADSLAIVFKQYHQLDSAAKYFAISAESAPSKEALIKAGDAYYEAFSFAVDADKSQELAENARTYYSKAMALDSGDELLDLKAKVAMTYIASSAPMQGIAMLREILEEDPEHEGAIYNLGILSIQSNQYDKAVERFEKLVSLYPENLQAQFYLGLSYYEAGKEEKAKEQFEKVKSLDSNPEVQAAVDGYLEEIQ